jgi:hypothetical protein
MWNIDREHPEYTVNAAMWSKYRDLYVGGEQIRRNASAYLYRRNKEPNEVFTERLAQVSIACTFTTICPGVEVASVGVDGDAKAEVLPVEVPPKARAIPSCP